MKYYVVVAREEYKEEEVFYYQGNLSTVSYTHLTLPTRSYV